MNVWTKLCDNEKVIFCGLWKTVKYLISSHCWDAMYSVWTFDINKDGQLLSLPTAKSCHVALAASFGANICTAAPEIRTCSTQFPHVCPPTHLRAQMSITIFHSLLNDLQVYRQQRSIEILGPNFWEKSSVFNLYIWSMVLWITIKKLGVWVQIWN